MMPATSLNERPEPFDAPAVAAGTVSETSTEALSCAGTVMLELPRLTECGDPAGSTCDTLLTPGAVTEGFSALSPLRGPADENDAKPRNPGFDSGAFVAVAVPPSASRSRAPSEVVPVGRPRTPKNGIVTS